MVHAEDMDFGTQFAGPSDRVPGFRMVGQEGGVGYRLPTKTEQQAMGGETPRPLGVWDGRMQELYRQDQERGRVEPAGYYQLEALREDEAVQNGNLVEVTLFNGGEEREEIIAQITRTREAIQQARENLTMELLDEIWGGVSGRAMSGPQKVRGLVKMFLSYGADVVLGKIQERCMAEQRPLIFQTFLAEVMDMVESGVDAIGKGEPMRLQQMQAGILAWDTEAMENVQNAWKSVGKPLPERWLL